MTPTWEQGAEAELRRILAEYRAHLRVALSYRWEPLAPTETSRSAEADRQRVRAWMEGR